MCVEYVVLEHVMAYSTSGAKGVGDSRKRIKGVSEKWAWKELGKLKQMVCSKNE